MEGEPFEPQAARQRKRLAGKPVSRQSMPKVKSTIHLTIEASRKLDIHATMLNLDRSALMEKLIHDHLRRYIVSDRGGENGSGETAG